MKKHRTRSKIAGIRPPRFSMTGHMWWVVQIKPSGSSVFESRLTPMATDLSVAINQAYGMMVQGLVNLRARHEYRIFNRWTGEHHALTARPRSHQGLDLRVGPRVPGEPDMPNGYRRFVICGKETTGWLPLPIGWGRVLDTNAFGEACALLYDTHPLSLRAQVPAEGYAVLDTEMGRVLTLDELQVAEAIYGEPCKTLKQANAMFGLAWHLRCTPSLPAASRPLCATVA